MIPDGVAAPGALEAVGAQARAALAAARADFHRARPAAAREPVACAPAAADHPAGADSLPRLMARAELARVEPCSGRRRS